MFRRLSNPTTEKKWEKLAERLGDIVYIERAKAEARILEPNSSYSEKVKQLSHIFHHSYNQQNMIRIEITMLKALEKDDDYFYDESNEKEIIYGKDLIVI
jgi:uncharacterized protein with von Willebrand factor type A (vWA) domain